MMVSASVRGSFISRVCWMVALLLLCSSAAVAQLPTGTVLGVVKDSSGAVVPGANVTVRNVETDQTRNVVTEADGSYRVPALPVGNYEVRATKEGFRSEVQSGLALAVSQEAVVNFTMEVGATGQTVSVTAEAPLVNTTTASLGGLVNEERMTDLPLNGRNYIDLSLLQPGVAEFKAVNRALTGNVGTYFVSNGSTVRSNMYLLDGAILTNILNANSASLSGSTLGVDGIREYEVITTQPGAEYGMVMGSWMTASSKSGSNNFHGDAFDYLRNSSMDAANYFDISNSADHFRRLPEFQRNDFGGSVGGPIQKDKTFFFGVYEGIRQNLGLSIVDTVPAAACHGAAGTVITVAACPQLGPPSGITSGTISPQTAAILALLPNPNVPGQNEIYFPYQQPTTDNYGQMRVDHTFNENDTMFARYTIQDTNQVQTEGYPGFTTPLSSRNQFLTLSENHVFSAALLNTARFSLSRTTEQSANGTANPSGAGLSYVPGFPLGPTTITGITGAYVLGSNLSAPTRRIQNIFTYSDDVFYTKGKHSLKFGTLVNHYQQRTGNGSYSSGQATFPSLYGLVVDAPSAFQAVTPGSLATRYFHFNTIGFYAQDDFRVRSNLTLNLGLRYEFFTVPQEQHDQWSHLANPATSTAVTISPATNNNSSLHNFSPRIGFAWDVKGDGKTAVRGGFATLYDVGQVSGSMGFQTLTANPPFTINYILSNPAGFSIPVVPGSAPGIPTLRLIDYNIKQPYMMQYNLSVERQLPWQTAVTLAYVGSRGVHLYDSYEGNPTIPSGIPAVVGGGSTCAARPAGQAVNLTSMEDGSATACWRGNEPRINPTWGSMNFFSAGADSYYNGMQFGVMKRLNKGLQFQSSYTWSRLIDTIASSTNSENSNSQTSWFVDPFHPILDRGPSPFDVTQVWKFNMIYNLPKYRSGEGFTGKLLSGWWTSTITTLQSGSPFTVALGSNRSNSKVGGGVSAEDRPDQFASRSNSSITSGVSTGCGSIPAGTPLDTAHLYFDPCAFSVPSPGFLGNVGRNTLRGPGFEDVDFSLVKDTSVKQLGESGQVEFRAEFFNILNHPNFGLPNRTIFSAGTGTPDNQAPVGNAGQITTTVGTSRQIQFALKLLF